MNRRTFLRDAMLALATGTCAAGTCLSLPSQTRARRDVLDAAAFHASRRFVTLECGDVAYVERGSGDVALFLHGFPLNGFQWRGAIERLAAQRRCIAPDFLGLGHTRVAQEQSVAPAAQVAMLVALLDALAIDAVDLIANDSGGAIAQLLVAGHPHRVRSLLLTNCDSERECPPAALQPVIELSRRGEFVDHWLAPWLADKVLARSAEGIGGMCYADPAQPTDAAIETYFAPLVATPRSKALVHAYAMALEHNALADIGTALGRSDVPLRIVWGDADTIFTPANADYLAASFGNSRGVRRLRHSKLFWPEERPAGIEH